MMHDELLEIAEELARREARRPKQASLKRAISSAYYALFHRLCWLCADELVGWSRPWEFVTPIYRTLDHGSARNALEQTRNGDLLGHSVADVGRVFRHLQELRHSADYDPGPLRLGTSPLGRSDVIDLIGQAREAIAAIASLDDETSLRLAIHLAAKQRK